MRSIRASSLAILPFLIGFSILALPGNCEAEQILKKGTRKILGYRSETENKFRSCRGKLIEIGDGQVLATNIKCGCATCPPIFGNRDRWDKMFKVAKIMPREKTNLKRFSIRQIVWTSEPQEEVEQASVLLREPPLKDVTLGYIGYVKSGNKFRTCDGEVMDVKESDRIEKTDIKCQTDINKLKRKLLNDDSHIDMQAKTVRQFLGIQLSKNLFLTCDNSIFELSERSKLIDTDLECDCDSCTESPVKPSESKPGTINRYRYQ